MKLPAGWTERADDLEAGRAQPGDYFTTLQAGLRSCKHGRRVMDGCTICEYESKPRWVPVFEGGICVRMYWFDPAYHSQVKATEVSDSGSGTTPKESEDR